MATIFPAIRDSRFANRDWLLAIGPWPVDRVEVARFGVLRLVAVRGGAGNTGEALLQITGQ